MSVPYSLTVIHHIGFFKRSKECPQSLHRGSNRLPRAAPTDCTAGVRRCPQVLFSKSGSDRPARFKNGAQSGSDRPSRIPNGPQSGSRFHRYLRHFGGRRLQSEFGWCVTPVLVVQSGYEFLEKDPWRRPGEEHQNDAEGKGRSLASRSCFFNLTEKESRANWQYMSSHAGKTLICKKQHCWKIEAKKGMDSIIMKKAWFLQGFLAPMLHLSKQSRRNACQAGGQ